MPWNKRASQPSPGPRRTTRTTRTTLVYTLLGVTVGALSVWLPMRVSADPAAASGWLDGGVEADGLGLDLEASLRDEVARLRSRLRIAEGRPGVVRSECAPDSPAVSAAADQPGGAAAPAVADAARMPELLAELRKLVASGALEAQFNEPRSLLTFLVGSWLAGGQPREAVGLMARFGLDESLAGFALEAVDSLLENGDRDTALHACLLLARSGLKRQELVHRALTLEPGRVLEELTAIASGSGAEWEGWNVQRGVLMLAAGEVKGALDIVDGLIAKQELPDWVWGELVQRAPEQATRRLEAAVAASKEADERHGLQCHLALAFEKQGRPADAARLLRELLVAQLEPKPEDIARRSVPSAEPTIEEGSIRESRVSEIEITDLDEDQLGIRYLRHQAGMDSSVVEAFGRIDPNGLRTYLAGLVQKRPTAQNWGLYGDSLAQARRPREAIAAWLEAIKLDPASGAARSLITHAPLEAIRQLRRGATERMDDEMLGDMGDALWQLGRRDDAVGLWQQAHGIDKGDGEWSMKLARVHSGADPLSR